MELESMTAEEAVKLLVSLVDAYESLQHEISWASNETIAAKVRRRREAVEFVLSQAGFGVSEGSGTSAIPKSA